MNINLFQECSKLVNQVPAGRVTTYGTVAKALGDHIARRAVGVMLNQYQKPIKMPCHRVVYAGGGLGGFGWGVPNKIKMLAEEGVGVQDSKIINFENILFDDFKCSFPLKKAREEQLGLAKKVILKGPEPTPDLVLGLDVAYHRTTAFGAGMLYDPRKMEPVRTIKVKMPVDFPYVPTYLGYREMPVYESIIEQIDEPVTLMLDGNGILHPLGIGIASHIGVCLGIPSMGVAKRKLCGEVERIPEGVGDSEPVILNQKIIGYALKTSKRAKPVFVSPGHLMSVGSALDLAKRLSTYKLPEPLRMAHQEAAKMRRGAV